ncbi:MAG: hypothetical protein IIC82_07535 [Chloroflexi bacterium]|nr:hypothetical protein [Chloroflexota bacterium]
MTDAEKLAEAERTIKELRLMVNELWDCYAHRIEAEIKRRVKRVARGS